MNQSKRGFFSFLPVALACILLCSGCSILPGFNHRLHGNRAFIKYWPPDPNANRLRLAIKDNIDMKGVITTAGSQFFLTTHPPAANDAPCVASARRPEVVIVGKTNLTEFAVA